MIEKKGNEKTGDFNFRNGEICSKFLNSVYSLGNVSSLNSKDYDRYDIEEKGSETKEVFKRDFQLLNLNISRVQYLQSHIRDELCSNIMIQ